MFKSKQKIFASLFAVIFGLSCCANALVFARANELAVGEAEVKVPEITAGGGVLGQAATPPNLDTSAAAKPEANPPEQDADTDTSTGTGTNADTDTNAVGGTQPEPATTVTETPQPTELAAATHPSELAKTSDSLATAPRLGALREASPVSAGDTIYLNGETGDDNNTGLTATTAVRSFAKAREMSLADQKIVKILVNGKTTVSGELSLAGTQAQIQRDASYKGYLFAVAANTEATFKDVTIDGNREAVIAERSLISVDGTLNIADNCTLQNNVAKDLKKPNNGIDGGAVYVSHGQLNMTGGTIRNNQATNGGAVMLYKATMTMTAGTIEGNLAKLLIDRSVTPTQFTAAGGGIAICDGSTLNFGGTAVIRNNRADEIGGGISVGRQQWSDGYDNLIMTGGTIDSNTAGSCGGGIFVQAGLFVPRFAKATISAGRITNNQTDGRGRTEDAFGGGGIYVNGGPEKMVIDGQEYLSVNGELHITNALITENEAKYTGSGLAACPVSKTYMYVKDGCIIAGNIAKGVKAKDIYMLSSLTYGFHSGEPEYDIAKRMLGGTPYDWHTPDGSAFPDEKLKGVLPDGESLSLNSHAMLSENIKKLAKVIITGNKSATRGGGIGSNGTIYMGEDKPKKDLEVVKTWDKSLTPETIQVELRGKLGDKDWLIERATLNAQNNFKHLFTGLPETIENQPLEQLVYIKEINTGKYQTEIAAAEAVNPNKLLSFELYRPAFSDNENLNAVYSNYYMQHPEANVFDEEAWALKDFKIQHILTDSQGRELAQADIKYTAADYSWSELAQFKNVPITTDEVEVQYYNDIDDEGDPAYVAPWLLKYELKLEVEGNKTIIKVPNLWPQSRNPLTGSEEERVLKVQNIKVSTEGGSTNQRFQIRVVNKPGTPPPPPPPPPSPDKPPYIPPHIPPSPTVPFEPGKPGRVAKTGESQSQTGLAYLLLLSVLLVTSATSKQRQS